MKILAFGASNSKTPINKALARFFAVQSAAFSLAENCFDASAVVPSPKSARVCSAAGVVPIHPAPS